MEDKNIICIQCGNPFVFTVTQQERFSTLEFDEPRRCPECRKKKVKGGVSRFEEKMMYKNRDNRRH